MLYVVLIWILIWILTLGYYRWHKSMVHGWLGEKTTTFVLHLTGIFFLKNRYALVNDLLIAKPDGNTTQIDHVFICNRGVFVIETKRWAGTIYGNISDREWTQQLGRLKHSKGNPLIQNAGHARAIAPLIDHFPLIPLVVFVGGTRLRITWEKTHYTRGWKLPWKILFTRKYQISREQMQTLTSELRSRNIAGGKARAEHTERIQAKYFHK